MYQECEFRDLPKLSELPLAQRLQEGLASKSEVGEFLREYLIPVLRYAHQLKFEVSFSVRDFDRVMKWGFGWELGPFELIDAIGAKELGIPNVDLNYRNGEVLQFNGNYVRKAPEPQFERLEDFKEIAAGETFRVRDLGNGVIAVILTSKMGVISPLTVSELTSVFQEKFERFVFASEAAVFSAGYDLKFLREQIEAGNMPRIDSELEALQNLGELMQAKRGVAAIYGYCLGAGLELALSTSKIAACAETQIGLPEARVGLIPGGRGVALMKLQNGFNAKRLAEVTLTVSQGTVAQNADSARQLGYLRSTDVTIYNPDRLIFVAKQAALEAEPRAQEIWTASLGPLVGMLDEGVSKLKGSGSFSDYDELIAGKLRQIVARSTSYSDALSRERAEFVDLCGRTLTQTRIKHMIDQGKPLRN
jgi:3-hydroxyacyl-CoA dehydrogenase